MARSHRVVISLTEVPQFRRLVEFVDAVDEQSAGDPDLQALVAELRDDLAAMRSLEDEG